MQHLWDKIQEYEKDIKKYDHRSVPLVHLISDLVGIKSACDRLLKEHGKDSDVGWEISRLRDVAILGQEKSEKKNQVGTMHGNEHNMSAYSHKQLHGMMIGRIKDAAKILKIELRELL